LSETRFRIDAQNVVHETVDGEVIAIDLADGSYYSLSGSGPVAWGLLSAGASAAEVGRALEARFDAGPGVIEAAVAGLLTRLSESGLIVADDDAVAPAPPEAAENGSREEFSPPVLERYDDMKDYFLLDPIHEVNPAAGWPKPAA
jgi:hypothetical protein